MQTTKADLKMKMLNSTGFCFRVLIHPTPTWPTRSTRTGENVVRLMLAVANWWMHISTWNITHFISDSESQSVVFILPGMLWCLFPVTQCFWSHQCWLSPLCLFLDRSAKERRSRILFMRQWSQVGHSRKRTYSHDELEKWAESLNSLLACPGKSCFFSPELCDLYWL